MNKEQQTELDRIKGRKQRLHAEDVIEAARPESSPLHSRFTWDVKRGFEANLRREAQELIREYMVVVTVENSQPIRTRYFVSLSTDRADRGGYRTVFDVMDDEALSEVMLDDALSELNVARAKYARVKELREVFAALEQVNAQHEKSKPKQVRKGMQKKVEATA